MTSCRRWAASPAPSRALGRLCTVVCTLGGILGCSARSEAPPGTPCAASTASATTARVPPPPAHAAQLVGANGPIPAPEWSAEEQGKEVALKTLRGAGDSSHHLVRLAKAEKPHVHDRSDLAVFVLSGPVRMHLGDRVFPVGPGDVVDIPKGTPHWAENAGDGPSFAYVVFSPAFDGKDRRFLDAPAP